MTNMLIVQIPNIKSNREFVAGLLDVPGVVVGNAQANPESKYLTLKEGAVLAGVNYHTMWKWVIGQKLIPYTRPSGKKSGNVKLLRSDIEAYMEGRGKKRKVRKSTEVSPI